MKGGGLTRFSYQICNGERVNSSKLFAGLGSFAGDSVITKVRRLFLSKVDVGIEVVMSALQALVSQEYLEALTDQNTMARVDSALESLFDVLNCDFTTMELLFEDQASMLESKGKEVDVIDAAKHAKQTCFGASSDYSIGNKTVFKQLRADVLSAGVAGAAMVEELLDSLNLEKKRLDFVQIFVSIDEDNDGIISCEDFENLVPEINDNLLSSVALDPNELRQTFEYQSQISITEFLEYIAQKQAEVFPNINMQMAEPIEFNRTIPANMSGKMALEFMLRESMRHQETDPKLKHKVAPYMMNLDHITIEGETQRKNKTGSMNKLSRLQQNLDVERQFELSPGFLSLGELRPGEKAVGTFVLTNVGYEPARFHIIALQAPFELSYAPGLLAAGMKRKIDVTLAVPSDSAKDYYCTQIVIRTPSNVLFGVAAARILR